MSGLLRTNVAEPDALMMSSPLELVAQARAGKMFVLLNSERPDSIGALVLPSLFASASEINFMATHGRGLIYLTMTEDRAKSLGLNALPTRYKQSGGPNVAVSIEARQGVSTGISAFDRAHTIRVATDPTCDANDIVTPGHVFPLLARKGGVLIRPGVTEGSVDICRLAGLPPSAVICEILKTDGSVADQAFLLQFAADHGLAIGTLNDLIAYRRKHDSTIVEIDRKPVRSTHGGNWTARVFKDSLSDAEHIALTQGDLMSAEPVSVRIHALDTMADVLGVHEPEQSSAIRTAMERITREGRGALVLLSPTARGSRQDGATDPIDFGLGAQILASMGLTQLRILVQNAPPLLPNLEAFGLHVAETEIFGTRST